MKKRRGAIIRSLLVVFLLMCLVLPSSIAYAEVPAIISEVYESAGMGVPFQHHSFIDSGRQWVFYTTADTLVYSTSTDMITWSAPTTVHHCEDAVDIGGNWTYDYSGTQFDLWYDSTNNKLDIVVLNTSANNSDLLYARFTPNALTGALVNVTAINPWQPSLSGGGANVSMVLPSICVTPSQQPIIAITRINASDTPAIDVGVIGFANPGTGTLMALTGVWPKYNLSATGNASAFGSVIPLPSGNISIQWVQAEGGEGYLHQAIIGITGGADTVGTNYNVDDDGNPSAPGYLWDYNALSIHTDAVTASGNEDVFIVWNKDEGGGLTSVSFNRKGDTLWDDTYQELLTDAQLFGQYVGAIGFRDSVGNIVYSAIGWDDENLYSANYGLDANVWNPYAEVAYIDTNEVQWATMANYEADIDGGDTGFIYQGYTALGDDVIKFGLYRTTTPSSIPASVSTMAWLVVLVFGAAICLMLLAYGASEAIKGGGTEFVKMGLVGFITFVVAAIIVAAML